MKTIRPHHLLPLLLLAVSTVATSQALAASRTVDPDGTIHVQTVAIPPSAVLSDEARKALQRPTEGPGAAQPSPANAMSMAERRVAMNNDLQPRVQHMRDLYPVDIEETTIDGIPVAIITPKGGIPARNRNRIMLNVPGGGFVTGIRANGLFISIPVASIGKMKVITALYRQGPEYRFPAATEDFMKVYKYALARYKPKNIGMLGCSAGGVLVAQTVAAALMSGMPAPGVLGLYCAGAGARFDGDSATFSSILAGGMGVGGVIAADPNGYLSGIDTTRTEVSPVNDLSLLARFPPTILATGTRDFAMSQAAYTHRRFLAAGVESDLLIYDGLGHGFMTNPDLPESRDLYDITVKFYDRHLGH